MCTARWGSRVACGKLCVFDMTQICCCMVLPRAAVWAVHLLACRSLRLVCSQPARCHDQWRLKGCAAV